MRQSLSAFLSPRDGFAGVIIGDGSESVMLVAPEAHKGGRIAAGDYLARFPDTCVIDAESSAEVVEQLTTLEVFTLALDLAMLFLDDGLHAETRRAVSQELGVLFANPAVRNYVLDVVFAAPLPATYGTENAMLLAEGDSETLAFLESVIEAQPRVKLVASAWLEMRLDPQVRKTGVDVVHGKLIKHSVFRRLVNEGRTQSDVSSLKTEITLSLRESCDPRIVGRFISYYSANLPPGLAVARGHNEQEATDAAGDDDCGIADRPTPRSMFAEQERGRAESQIERITQLFAQGSDGPAGEMLNQLVKSQTSSSSNHEYVVKSLCNIATRCMTKGRRDIGIDCLGRALDYPSGIDSILYIQIGIALRDATRLCRKSQIPIRRK